ncbi:uncharacterized protein LOC143861663 [Tasmannia lanceolata]|uniref:uncharacterized protein LOC143861663 n=1 Tax=Tasmannia lanceolata TaxID=3420 RepID=UPI004064BC49
MEEAKDEKALPGISLRQFEQSDVDHFMAWAGNDQVTQFCRWDTFTCREEALKYLKEVVIPHPWFRAICLENRPIGSIYVSPGTEKDRCRGEIGYALSSMYWGRGITTSAVTMALASIFRDLPNLERIEGLVFAENKGSQRVLEKAGFTKEGLLRNYFTVKGKTRDIVIYSFLPSELSC